MDVALSNVSLVHGRSVHSLSSPGPLFRAPKLLDGHTWFHLTLHPLNPGADAFESRTIFSIALAISDLASLPSSLQSHSSSHFVCITGRNATSAHQPERQRLRPYTRRTGTSANGQTPPSDRRILCSSAQIRDGLNETMQLRRGVTLKVPKCRTSNAKLTRDFVEK